jgi:hypothetical protein
MPLPWDVCQFIQKEKAAGLKSPTYALPAQQNGRQGQQRNGDCPGGVGAGRR